MNYKEQKSRKSQAEKAIEKAAEFLKIERRAIRIDEKTIILHRNLTDDPDLLADQWRENYRKYNVLSIAKIKIEGGTNVL